MKNFSFVMNKKRFSLAIVIVCIVGLFAFQCLASWINVPADGKDARERDFFREYRYMLGLQWEHDLRDAANTLLEKLREQFPEPRYIVSLDSAHFDNLVLEGKFDEILANIGKQVDADSYEIGRIKSVLADVYLLLNRYEDFLELHQKFSKTFPWIAEEEQEDNLVRSVKTLRIIRLAADMEDDPERNMLLAKAEKEIDELLKITDPMLGLAVVAKAHIMSLRDDDTNAQKMVAQYMSQIHKHHYLLMEKSPKVAGCVLQRENLMPRFYYLLGKIFWDKAQIIAARPNPTQSDNEQILDLLLGVRDKPNAPRKGDGAFNHFTNFIHNYPESRWFMMAMEEQKKIVELFHVRFGIKAIP
jgi:tetratricopeptide (TPR) repeat protein